jgi:hypothetical protein
MYKIVISCEREETELTKREYHRTGRKDNDGKDEWEYGPQVEERQIVTRVLLEQSVDELDVIAVIKAINGIS